ncbi:MAG: hypothetical protein HYT37_00100 [Candidatus Sungbacteria bacterium]|nr:hypothetical protein [Candidatus Sungbacteria bacterium]
MDMIFKKTMEHLSVEETLSHILSAVVAILIEKGIATDEEIKEKVIEFADEAEISSSQIAQVRDRKRNWQQ